MPRRGWGMVLVQVTALAVLGVPAAVPAAAEPLPPEVTAELRARYREAAAAVAAYRESEERLAGQRERLDRVAEELAATRTRLAEARQTVGRLAGQQYRQGAAGARFPAAVRLLLSGGDPLDVLRAEHAADRAAAGQAAALRTLAEDEGRERRLAGAERAALDAEQVLALMRERRQQEALARVEELEEALAATGGPAADADGPDGAEPTGGADLTGGAEGAEDAGSAESGGSVPGAPDVPGSAGGLPDPGGALAALGVLGIRPEPGAELGGEEVSGAADEQRHVVGDLGHVGVGVGVGAEE